MGFKGRGGGRGRGRGKFKKRGSGDGEPRERKPVDEIFTQARNGELEALRTRLETDPEAVDLVDNIARTPLHMAAWAGNLSIVQLLMSNGATVDAAALDNMTPLQFAAGNCHAEVCSALLAEGADPNIANSKTGKTPLMSALNKLSLATVQALMEAGADPEVKTAGRKSVFDFMQRKEAELPSGSAEQATLKLIQEAIGEPASQSAAEPVPPASAAQGDAAAAAAAQEAAASGSEQPSIGPRMPPMPSQSEAAKEKESESEAEEQPNIGPRLPPSKRPKLSFDHLDD